MDWWQFIAFAVLLDFAYFKLSSVRPGGAPTYYGLPFVGFAFIRILPSSVFTKFFKFYLKNAPDVLITRLPAFSVVIKHDAIKDVQQNPDCLPRPRFNYTDAVSWLATDTLDWTFFDGVRSSKIDQWQTSRKIGIAALYAGPKSKMVAKMSDVAEVFLKEVEKHEGQEWDPARTLMVSKFQEVMHLFFGTVMESQDIEGYADYFVFSSQFFNAVITAFKILPFALLPVLKAALYPIVKFNYLKNVYMRVLWKLYQGATAAHSENDSRDYITAIASSRKSDPDLLYYLREITFTSFHVATHTTWHTILSVLSLLAIHQDVQRRVLEEIRKVIGHDDINTDNLEKLSYMKAVISEALRMYPPVPQPIRMTRRATSVGGFRIPKAMMLVPLIHSENYNPTHFPQPDAFRPSRFIDAEGNFFHDANLGTFARGKRACPGKNFVYMSAAIYLVKISQRFAVEPISSDTWLGEFQGEFFPSAGKLHRLRFTQREGLAPIRDVQLDTKLSQIVRDAAAAESEANS